MLLLRVQACITREKEEEKFDKLEFYGEKQYRE